jgi:hypothetical protein
LEAGLPAGSERDSRLLHLLSAALMTAGALDIGSLTLGFAIRTAIVGVLACRAIAAWMGTFVSVAHDSLLKMSEP